MAGGTPRGHPPCGPEPPARHRFHQPPMQGRQRVVVGEDEPDPEVPGLERADSALYLADGGGVAG